MITKALLHLIEKALKDKTPESLSRGGGCVLLYAACPDNLYGVDIKLDYDALRVTEFLTDCAPFTVLSDRCERITFDQWQDISDYLWEHSKCTTS
jgi:hypothetical protein